jgi:glutamine amidotransferase-like uncharacterized protein
MSIITRLKVCWYILTNREFYCAVVTDRYSDGEVLATLTLSNLPYTETAIKKVQKALKRELEMLKITQRTRITQMEQMTQM